MSQTKTALITGSAKRIGAVIAKTLHRAGFSIIIHYNHSATDANVLAQTLNSERSDSAVTVQADLLAQNSAEQLIKQAVSAWGQLDVLINNASTFYPTPTASVTPAQWDDLLGTNLQAPFFLAQQAIAPLQVTKGQIINITDIHVERPLQDHIPYCVAKAGLECLTRALARELAPAIRVNAVAPGAILWPEQTDTERQKTLLTKIPLSCLGKPEDIGNAVLCLIDNPYITGQTLTVDGGQLC